MSTTTWVPTFDHLAHLDDTVIRDRVLLLFFDRGIADSAMGRDLDYMAGSLTRREARASALAVAAICYWAGGDLERAQSDADSARELGSQLGSVVGESIRSGVPCLVLQRSIENARDPIMAYDVDQPPRGHPLDNAGYEDQGGPCDRCGVAVANGAGRYTPVEVTDVHPDFERVCPSCYYLLGQGGE